MNVLERLLSGGVGIGNPMTYVLGPGDELSRKFFFPLTPLCASQDRSLSESAIGV